MSAETQWWYVKEGQRIGPISANELKSLAAEGQLRPSDMVWKEGLENWLPASSVKGLIQTDSVGHPPPLPSNSGIPALPPITASAKPRKMGLIAKVALWIGGAFFGLIVLGVIVGPNEKGNSSTRQQTPRVEPVRPTVKVGDSFSTPTFEVQILSAQPRSSVGNSMFASHSAEGGIYVAIQWSYKNTSLKPVNAFSRPTINLKAPDGTKYNPDIGASASYATELNNDAKVFSDLNPGIRVVDATVFEVSRQMFDSSSWRILVIDAGKATEIEFVVPQ